MNEIIQAKNLFKSLIKDENSIFFSADKINKTLLKKSRKSNYDKDKVFYKIYNSLEDKEIIYEDDNEKRIPLKTPFVEQKKDIDRTSTLFSVNSPLQFFHADVADIRFFSKSAVDPKYALICVDVFSSKVYLYSMKNKSNLARKLEQFYNDIDTLQKNPETIRLQTDLEFQQNEIKKINKKYNVEMFSTKIRGGKAFIAEQKIRELKKILLKSKRLHKTTSTERFDPKKTIARTVNNLNRTISEKYGISPEEVEKKSIESKIFKEVYDFHRLKKVNKDAERYERYDISYDKKTRKKLRDPLEIGEKVLVLAERIRKKRRAWKTI